MKRIDRKKIVSIIIGMTLLLPLFLSLILLIRIELNHFEKEKQLENNWTVRICLSEKNINWIKHGKEVIIEGQWFDVQSIDRKNGQIILTGIFDTEEGELLKMLQKNESNNHSKKCLTAFLLLVQVRNPAQQDFIGDSPGQLFIHS